MTERLARLERTMRELGGGTCRLCYGTPVAAIHVIHELDPDGPGLRETGDRYLANSWADRVTDDLCCVRCGTPAVRIHLMTCGEVEADSLGRKLPQLKEEGS